MYRATSERIATLSQCVVWWRALVATRKRRARMLGAAARPDAGNAATLDCHRFSSVGIPHIGPSGSGRSESAALVQARRFRYCHLNMAFGCLWAAAAVRRVIVLADRWRWRWVVCYL